MLENIDSVFLYIFIYICSAMCFYVSTKVHSCKWFWVILSVTLPVFFAAIRENVGSDWGTYLSNFRKYKNISWSEFWKNENAMNFIGEFLVAKLAHKLGGQTVFYGIFALLSYLPILLFCRNNYRQASAFLVSFLFLITPFTNGLNIMKQTAAMSIGFYGIRFAQEKRIIPFLITIFAAMAFHSTAVILIPVYFVCDKRTAELSKWKKLLLVLGAVLFVVMLSKIFPYLSRTELFDRYSIYEEAKVLGNNYMFYLRLALLVLLCLFYKPMIELDSKNELMYIMLIVGICLEKTGSYASFIKRISEYYYTIPSSILLAQLPRIFKKDDMRLIAFLGVCIYAIGLFVVMYHIFGLSDVLPYQMI